MSLFKSKREKGLEELVELYREKIDEFKGNKENFASRFVPIAVPQENDMAAYWTKLTAFITDPLYVFYLTQLRREIVDNFEGNGKSGSEFYRGMLSAIGQIFLDARKAQKQLSGVKDIEI
jgi:hypothetical protein